MSYCIETSGAKGNAYCVMGQVIMIMSEARETMGWDDNKFKKEKDAYLSAAQSSDYQNLLEVSYAAVDRVNKMVETLSYAHKIRMHWKTLEFYEGREFLNTLPDGALDEIYSKIRSAGIEIPTYEEYKKSNTKYHGETCFVAGCDAPAPYEGGDERYYCPMCERHAGVRESYVYHIWKKAGVR